MQIFLIHRIAGGDVPVHIREGIPHIPIPKTSISTVVQVTTNKKLANASQNPLLY